MDWTPIIVSVITSGGALVGVHIVNKRSKKIQEETRPVRHWFNNRNERKVSIIVLDDSQDDLFFIGLALKETGYQYEMFQSEQEYKKSLTHEANVHVIDHFLDSGVSGFEILREIKDRNVDNFVIIFSGTEDDTVMTEYMNSDADRYVNKRKPDPYKNLVKFVNQGVLKIANRP